MNWNEYFYYKEGELYWKIKVANRIKQGDLVGNFSKIDYKRVKLLGKTYLVHRVIYEMMMGSIPEGYQVDHINGDKLDNRIENLRLATPEQNSKNTKGRTTSKTGVKGVFFHKASKKYRSDITINKGKVCLGYFDTIKEAAAAYATAAKLYHEEFAKT